jgi:citrate synthase
MGVKLGEKTGIRGWHELFIQMKKHGMEEFKNRNKPDIQPKVDFCSAPVYHVMGFPSLPHQMQT